MSNVCGTTGINRSIIRLPINKAIFNPSSRKFNLATKPILVCVGDVTHNSNFDAFCSIPTYGTKLLVGYGPYLENLKSRYTDVIYVGQKTGASLAHYYANADVVVVPNFFTIDRKIIFESNACGTPVAGYPVSFLLDAIIQGKTGYMSWDLCMAISKCLEIDRNAVFAESISQDNLFFDSTTSLIEH
jgi:glycosyltransferase involved in cell wall biosynthesis